MFIMALGAGLVLAVSLRSLGMKLPRLGGAALWLAWWEVQVAVGWPTWRLTSLVAGLVLALQVALNGGVCAGLGLALGVACCWGFAKWHGGVASPWVWPSCPMCIHTGLVLVLKVACCLGPAKWHGGAAWHLALATELGVLGWLWVHGHSEVACYGRPMWAHAGLVLVLQGAQPYKM